MSKGYFEKECKEGDTSVATCSLEWKCVAEQLFRSNVKTDILTGLFKADPVSELRRTIPAEF